MSDYPQCLNYYQCKHFRIEELVPKKVFEELGGRAWGLFDSRILSTMDTTRDILGVPMVVNDWLWGGNHQYRGWRPTDWRPDGFSQGAKYSQHFYGRAIDSVSPHMPAEQMRLKIIENNKLFSFLTRIENKVSWLHLDCKNVNVSKIHLFNP